MSFWEALAFVLVKGVNECMPTLLTSAEILIFEFTESVPMSCDLDQRLWRYSHFDPKIYGQTLL
ncbi:hypothetical protein PAXRUDRAFT_20746 [Paxillus rubicundulus Ve08.2h10]|uniref:Uncharacterized protein n=1 Tax=Paxillus rubicundulus Ve08.2h10 TaxID=930991 RepID=A0A0D0BPT5_9AGAM|nr:hypothetical protein PAXRUDRAFT_20746 [Paxillus rubicundulus Ve08.2h10]